MLEKSGKSEINLLTIVSINDIRRQNAKVTYKISWEQSALDLVFELKNNPNLAHLLKSRYLIVMIQTSGAVLVINNGDDNYEYRLVFDPIHLENEWEEKLSGNVIGRMSCFTSALLANLSANPNKNYNIEPAIYKGLMAVRSFFTSGYLVSESSIKYPFSKIKEDISKENLTYSSAFIPTPSEKSVLLPSDWTILKNNYELKNNVAQKTLYDLARQVAVDGLTVLKNIPSIRINKLFTVDRNEIESFREIKIIIHNYEKNRKATKPLSIAVFGQPGSGKSFVVEQLAKEFNLPFLEFNLSQFTDSNDLDGAFHQVRDEVLRGKIPLVFWDEFDARQYDWLQYLLAPMQDGTFQENQITHTIGKCIMVFAGGTSYKMEHFCALPEGLSKVFKMKKGPDFISRLNGFINVSGPNQNIILDKKQEKWVDDVSDICFPVRRALFIRQILGLKENEHLDIEWGLLNALLKVKKYKHGARSLTNLLQIIAFNSEGKKLNRSHLPSNSNLKLYVDDVEDFLKHLTELIKYQDIVTKIAPAIHQVWMGKSVKKNPDYNVEFDLLPVFIKESNIAAAVRIPQVLEKAKLKMVHKADEKVMTEVEFIDYIKADNNNYLEKMAEAEHNLWMEFYLNNGWTHSDKRNDYKKEHDCLKKYADLSESDKDKDRESVKKYWYFLDDVGLGIAEE